MINNVDASAIVETVEGPRLSIPFVLINKIGLENAAFLQQSAFLSSLKFRNGGSGWFDLPAEGDAIPESQNMFERLGSWKAALGIKRDSLRKIRAALKKLNLLEEKKCGIPARIHYRVNSNSYLQFLASCSLPSSIETNENTHRNQECEISQTGENTGVEGNSSVATPDSIEHRKQDCEISQTGMRNIADLPAKSRKLACEISQYNPESYRELESKDNNIVPNAENSELNSKPAKASGKKRNTKPQAFKDLFAIYPAHRKGGTDASAWQAWKAEKLTDADAEQAITWLSQSDQSIWGTNADCQFAKGITKFIRDYMWRTPVQLPNHLNINQCPQSGSQFVPGPDSEFYRG